MSTEAAPQEERLIGGYSGRLLASVSLGTTVIFIAQLVLPALLPAVIDDLSITPFLAGLGLSVMWGLVALLQYPGGRASDRLSRKTIVVVALGTVMVGVLLLSQATVYVLYLVGLAAIGAGAGMYHGAVFGLLADLFSERRGQAFGINTGASDLGGLFAAGLGIVILAHASWRVAFFPILVAGLLVLATAHLWNAEPYVLTGFDLEVRSTVSQLFATPQLRLVIVSFGLFMFVYQGTTSFFPTFLQVEKGFTPVLANNAFGLLFLAGITIKPLAGRFGDRYGHLTVGTVGTVLAATGLATATVTGNRWIVLVSVFTFGAGLATFWPVMNAHLMDVFPDASMGGDLGALRATSYAVGSLGSAYVGFVAERTQYVTAFGGLVLCALAMIGVALWLTVKHG